MNLERLLQYNANKTPREWTKEKEAVARTAKEQEKADRRHPELGAKAKASGTKSQPKTSLKNCEPTMMKTRFCGRSRAKFRGRKNKSGEEEGPYPS